MANGYDVIVMGGENEDGRILKSVEGYSCGQDKWIELPQMNIPRSSLSSVVVGNEIIVSGGKTTGNTGDAITDTIEVLDLAETPLQWRVYPARLPVPLSAHQTVVYNETLIAIGGYNGEEKRNSEKIFKIPLTPPDTAEILATMPTPVAWHGAELVGDEIFIFGGETDRDALTNVVFSYNLVKNTLLRTTPLHRAMFEMATVKIEDKKVLMVGGFGRDNPKKKDHLESNEVFVYDTYERKVVRNVTEMNEIRGDCSATTIPSPDRGPILVVLGSSSSPGTVEGYDFVKREWFSMSSTIEERNNCSVVAAHPTEIPSELIMWW